MAMPQKTEQGGMSVLKHQLLDSAMAPEGEAKVIPISKALIPDGAVISYKTPILVPKQDKTTGKDYEDYLKIKTEREQQKNIDDYRTKALFETNQPGVTNIMDQWKSAAGSDKAHAMDAIQLESLKDEGGDPSPERVIHLGKASLADSLQSGAIMNTLTSADKGFLERVRRGIKTGHTYTIFHMPNSVNFTLMDQMMVKGEIKTRYQHFEIVRETLKKPNSPESVESPLDALLRTTNTELDELLGMMKQ